MIDARDISAKSQEVRNQLEAKLGVRSGSLRQALKRAGRRLPRGMRRQGARLLEAEQLASNPRLARQIQPTEVNTAFNALTRHLAGIDVTDRRKGRWLSLAASIAGNLLIIVAGFLVWLWWQGYV